MNAILRPREKDACGAQSECAMDDSPRSNASALGIAPCGRNQQASQEISARLTEHPGWGGARANSGGSRPGFGGRQPGAGRPRKQVEVQPEGWQGLRWCVFQTHPSAETTASHEITRSGYRAYMPLIAIRRQDAVVRSMFHKVRVPMFAGYGFVELTVSQPWVPIRYMTGVRDVLLTPSGRPGPVPVGFVERLIEGDEARCDLTPETMPPIKIGARVEILEGALQSFFGMVLGCDGLRTMVNVELFGRLVAVRVERASVNEV